MKLDLDAIKGLSDMDLNIELSLAFQVDGRDFCNDLNAIAEIEQLIIHQIGRLFYFQRLLAVINGSAYVAEVAITASARQRSEAALLTLNEKRK